MRPPLSLRHARAAVLLVCALPAGAQDWPQWRGPNRDGSIEGAALPASWPERLVRQWAVVVGEGHSSPVAADGRVYQFSRLNDKETVTALGAGGKILWRVSYDAPYQMNPAATGHGKGPKSTPVLHRARLYTLGISGILSCFDAEDGRRLWQKDFSKRFRTTSPLYGAAMSPIVHQETLIAHVGGDGGGALAAFDLATGAEKWTWTGDGPGYASPVIVALGGAPHLLTQSESKIIAIAPDTGRLLWEIPFATPWAQNIVTPVVQGGSVILSGLASPTLAVRPRLAQGKWTVERLWEAPDASMYMSSPVLAANRILGFTNRNKGQLFLQDPASGKVLWTGKPRLGDNAAILHAGATALVLTTEAELSVARITDAAVETLRTYSVADTPVWAHPAPVTGGLLVKDRESLSLWAW